MKHYSKLAEKAVAVSSIVCLGCCVTACYAQSDRPFDDDGDSASDVDGEEAPPRTGTGDESGDLDTSPTADDSEQDTDTDTSIYLMPDTEGWLDRDANALGMQGAWYTYGGNGAVYSPAGDEQIFNDGAICFSGYAPPVWDEDVDGLLDYETQYGAAIAFDTCAIGGPVPLTPTTRYPLGECPFNEDLEDQIVGISVTFAPGGSVYPQSLWIVFSESDEAGNAYIVLDPLDISEGKVVDAYFADAVTSWDPGRKPEGTVPSEIIAIQFQVPTNSNAEINWDFCITEIKAILGNGVVHPGDGR